MAFIVPKYVVKKVEAYQHAINKAEELYAELQNFFHDEMDGVYMTNFFTSIEPCGQEQNDGEYCDQRQGYIEDDFSGNYYYPTKDGLFIGISYET